MGNPWATHGQHMETHGKPMKNPWVAMSDAAAKLWVDFLCGLLRSSEGLIQWKRVTGERPWYVDCFRPVSHVHKAVCQDPLHL